MVASCCSSIVDVTYQPILRRCSLSAAGRDKDLAAQDMFSQIVHYSSSIIVGKKGMIE